MFTPFVSYNSDFSDSEFAFGNPYLGVMLNNSDQRYFLEAGLRAPLASDEKLGTLFTGVFSDYDRAEAYFPDMFSISLKNTYLEKNDSGFILKLMGGLSFWIPTNDNNDETEILVDYSGHAGYEGSKVQVLGGITGRLITTEDDLDFIERTIHQFGVFVRYKSNKVQPGLLLKLPLDDDFNDIVNFVLGLNVLINFD